MRIATFNVHHGTVGKDGPVDPERLGEVCAGFDADVIGLQEVDLGTLRTHRADLAGSVARACGMAHVFGRSRWYPGGAYGNALLVRGEIRSWTVVPLPRVPAWKRWQERRTVLVAEVVPERTQQPITVSVTHLAVPREVSTVQLSTLLEGAAERAPGCVLGDLNLRPSVIGPVARAAGLELVAHDPTSPAPGPIRSIDHVLLTSGLRVVGTEVRVTPMSDHAALLVDVEPGGGAILEGDR